MSSSRSIYFGGQKGGSTKTTTSHLVCLGAILHKQPAAYVLTDPHRELKENGRPYSVLDGRNPRELANIIGAIDAHKTAGGSLMVVAIVQLSMPKWQHKRTSFYCRSEIVKKIWKQ